MAARRSALWTLVGLLQLQFCMWMRAMAAAGSCSDETPGKCSQSLLQAKAVRWSSELSEDDDDDLMQELRQGPPSSVAAAEQLNRLEISLAALDKGEPSPGLEATVEAMKKLLVGTMMPEIWSAHNASEATILVFSNNFEMCEESRTTNDAAVADLSDTLANLSSEHRECRVELAGVAADNASATADLVAATSAMEDKCALLKEIEAPMLEIAEQAKPQVGETYKEYILRVQAKFNALVLEHDAAKALCDNKTAEVVAAEAAAKERAAELGEKREVCSMPQRGLESAGCQRITKAMDSCRDYDVCFESAKSAYESGRSTAESAEAQRKAEYRAIKRIECLLEAFDGNTSERVDECKKRVHYTGDLDIAYFVVPDKRDCSADFEYPCGDNWLLRHYGDIPVAAEADACVACPGIKPAVTTTTTTTTKAPWAVGFDYGDATFIYDETCKNHNSACEGAGLEPPRSNKLEIPWNQAACDAIALGLGKSCSRGLFLDGDKDKSGMWCQKDTGECGTTTWGDAFFSYSVNAAVGCVVHCMKQSPPQVVPVGDRPSSVDLAVGNWSSTFGYGVETPCTWCGATCPNGENPVGTMRYEAGAKYSVYLEKDADITVQVLFGKQGGGDRTSLQWNRKPSIGDNILAAGDASANKLELSVPISLSKGLHTLWIGTDGARYPLPWCSITVVANMQPSCTANWATEVTGKGFSGVVGVRAKAWKQHSGYYQVDWPIVRLFGTGRDGTRALYGGRASQNGKDACLAVCQSLTNSQVFHGWSLPQGLGYPASAVQYANECWRLTRTGFDGWQPQQSTVQCRDPMQHCQCTGRLPALPTRCDVAAVHQWVEVNIGNTYQNRLCVNTPWKVHCETNAGDAGFRSNTDHPGAPDRFEISRGDDIRSVCARRLDSPVGWGMHLKIICITTG